MKGVDLDWKFDEDEGDELAWVALKEEPQPGIRPLPAYSGMERHPDLMNLVVKSGFAVERDPAGFYLKMSFVVFGFLLALYLFV